MNARDASSSGDLRTEAIIVGKAKAAESVQPLEADRRDRSQQREAGAAHVAVWLGLARLPAGVTWTMLYGCAWLGGIGFTMSLFVATLAFEGTSLLDSAKVGILGASIVAGAVGATVLRRGNPAALSPGPRAS